MTAVQTRSPIRFAAPDVTEADIEAVVAVLRSGWLTTGAVAQAFEEQLAHATGRRHVLVTSSCTTALECAVAALRLPPASRVAVPAWTFVSTVTVLLRLGLRPVLLDVDATTLNVSAAALSDADERGRLSAFLPVHFAGTPVAPAAFEVADRLGLPVVEDCAHALGARLPAGRPSVASCYSFYATKNLTSAEGGALATDDDDVAQFASTYRLHGLSRDAWRRYEPGATPTYDLDQRGIKANLPDLLAALGLSQLRRFAEMQARRRRLVLHYRALLAGVPEVGVVPAQHDPDGADHLLVVLLPAGTGREAVIRRMAADGITVSVHFRPVHRFRAIAPELDTSGGLPVCEQMWPRVLSLPLHSTLRLEDAERVVESLAGAVREQVRS